MTISETIVDNKFIKEMEKYREPDKTVPFLEACSKNVVVFAEHMLGVKLYSWQVLFLNKIQEEMVKPEGEREFVAITSRQIGKSKALSIFCVWACIFNKYPGTTANNTSALIVSASDVQAKKLLYEMKKDMRMGNVFMKGKYKNEDGTPLFGEAFFDELLSENEPNNTTTITFKPWDEEIHGVVLKGSKSGSTIKSYPPTSAVLGETASIVIEDEAGKSDKITDQFHYDYLYPTGNSTNAVRIYTSTPWGPSGFFYRMVDPDDMYGESPGYVVLFTMDAIKVENDFQYNAVSKIVNQLNKDGKTDEVQRAYYCRFIKGESSYFDPQDIFNSFHDYAMHNKHSGQCDMGVDFGGQVKSKTVITISEYTEDGIVRRLYHKSYEVGKDTDLLQDISDLKKLFNIQRIIVDDCLDQDTEVLMWDYTRKKIKDINKGDLVWSYNFKKEKYEIKPVTKAIYKGKQNTNKVSFRNGTSVYATDGHLWFTKWRNTKFGTGKTNIKKTTELDNTKEYIPQAINIPNGEHCPITEVEAYLLGMYIAEGHRRPTKRAFFISQTEQSNKDKLKRVLEQTSWKWQENKKGFYISEAGDYMLDLIDKCGKSAYDKRIPEEVFQFSYVLLSSLKLGLIDGDGCTRKAGVDKRGYNYGYRDTYYTVSPQLASDMQLLNLLINEPSSMYSRIRSGFGSTKMQYEIDYRENSSLVKGKTNIKSIEDGGIREVYDIVVGDNESFILPESGVITHNCPAGQVFIRQMEEEKGWDIERMSFRADKVKKYGAFRVFLKRGKIVSYEDEDLKTEMLAMEHTPGSRQSNIQHAPGYSDDLIDSFLMSTYFFIEDEDTVSFFDWDREPEETSPMRRGYRRVRI